MINRIMCGVDGTDHSQVALLAAAELAARFGADLTVCLVNVVFGRSPRSPHVPTWTDAEAKRIGTATLFPGNAKKNLPQDWSKEKHQTMPLHCAKGGR